MQKREENTCHQELNCENQILHNLHKIENRTAPRSSLTQDKILYKSKKRKAVKNIVKAIPTEQVLPKQNSSQDSTPQEDGIQGNNKKQIKILSSDFMHKQPQPGLNNETSPESNSKISNIVSNVFRKIKTFNDFDKTKNKKKEEEQIENNNNNPGSYSQFFLNAGMDFRIQIGRPINNNSLSNSQSQSFSHQEHSGNSGQHVGSLYNHDDDKNDEKTSDNKQDKPKKHKKCKSKEKLHYHPHKCEKKPRKKCVIYPDNQIKDGWDIYVTLLLVFSCLIIPYRIAFIKKEEIEWRLAMQIVDVFFLFDILVNFQSSYFDEELQEIDEFKLIAKRYVYGWFTIDLLSIFPFELVLESSNINGLVRFVKIGKLSKLVKLTRLVRIFKIVLQKNKFMKVMSNTFNIGQGFDRLFFFIAIFFVLCHTVSCLLVIMAVFQDENLQGTMLSDFQSKDLTDSELYAISFYWTITTITTVGYGDISATNYAEYWFSSILMIIGVISFSLANGSLSLILSQIDTKDAILQEKLTVLNKIRSNFDLPCDLYVKCKKNLEQTQQSEYEEMEKLLSILPHKLKVQISLYIYEGRYKRVRFFQDKSSSFISWICPLLRQQMFEENMYIYNEEDDISNIFFLLKGKAGSVLPQFQNVEYIRIGVGDQFGIIDIYGSSVVKNFAFDQWLIHKDNLQRQFTVMATEKADVLCMNISDLGRMKREFYDIYDELFKECTVQLKRQWKIKLRAIKSCRKQLRFQSKQTVTSDEEQPSMINRNQSRITLKYEGAINLGQIDEQTLKDSESSSSLSESSSEEESNDKDDDYEKSESSNSSVKMINDDLQKSKSDEEDKDSMEEAQIEDEKSEQNACEQDENKLTETKKSSSLKSLFKFTNPDEIIKKKTQSSTDIKPLKEDLTGEQGTDNIKQTGPSPIRLDEKILEKPKRQINMNLFRRATQKLVQKQKIIKSQSFGKKGLEPIQERTAGDVLRQKTSVNNKEQRRQGKDLLKTLTTEIKKQRFGDKQYNDLFQIQSNTAPFQIESNFIGNDSGVSSLMNSSPQKEFFTPTQKSPQFMMRELSESLKTRVQDQNDNFNLHNAQNQWSSMMNNIMQQHQKKAEATKQSMQYQQNSQQKLSSQIENLNITPIQMQSQMSVKSGGDNNNYMPMLVNMMQGFTQNQNQQSKVIEKLVSKIDDITKEINDIRRNQQPQLTDFQLTQQTNTQQSVQQKQRSSIGGIINESKTSITGSYQLPAIQQKVNSQEEHDMNSKNEIKQGTLIVQLIDDESFKTETISEEHKSDNL